MASAQPEGSNPQSLGGAPKPAPAPAPPGGGDGKGNAATADKPGGQGGEQQRTGIERLKLIGGLVALSVGLGALIVVVVVSLLVEPNTTGGSIATSAIAVVGSMVGAYFGVKIGTDGTQTAINAQQEEATKAQVFALHTPADKAPEALAELHALLEKQKQPSAAR